MTANEKLIEIARDFIAKSGGKVGDVPAIEIFYLCCSARFFYHQHAPQLTESEFLEGMEWEYVQAYPADCLPEVYNIPDFKAALQSQPDCFEVATAIRDFHISHKPDWDEYENAIGVVDPSFFPSDNKPQTPKP